MEDEADLREIVHAELRSVAAGIRPPEADLYLRNAPSPELIEFVVVKLLIPILTSVVSGLVTRTLGARREKKNAVKIESQLSDIRSRLDKIAAATRMDSVMDDDLDAIIVEITRMRALEPGPPDAPADGLETEIASILQTYRLPAATARARASAIIAQIFR